MKSLMSQIVIMMCEDPTTVNDSLFCHSVCIYVRGKMCDQAFHSEIPDLLNHFVKI